MNSKSKNKLSIYHIVLFPLFAAIMFASDILLDFAMNVHLLGMLITVFTVIYRAKALIPIYIYVLLYGIFYGFSGWGFGYLYVWAVLWAVVMLLPRKMKPTVAAAVYAAVAGLHGLAFGTLLAPLNSFLMGFDFNQTVAWIFTGFYADLIHCVSNVIITAFLAMPLINVLEKAELNLTK